ncbi:MAG: tRNA pseudouridine(55) synthase TruB [Candidatus Nomurabacteria bacterium]|nr:tRNA pseudouridine(55) synthase TruB [Candidatus Nomurabacteria bacterium]
MENNHTSELPEMMLIDKPSGITSFDVIRRLRKKHGKIKMGHAGTLDPLATGLMIIGVGQGTKKLNDYLKLPKVYIAEILLGVSTDTGDTDGNIVTETAVHDVDSKKVEQVVGDIVGTHEFQAPLYSALKVDGKPLYKYARAGQAPPRIPTKTMTVHSAQVLDQFDRGNGRYVVRVRFDVASGTYIRTLAEEIGRQLGVPATLRYLRRTSIGEFKIDDAISLDE